MKKQLFVFAAILAIFATSCSSFRIEKRHYKNGFYVHKSSGKNHEGNSAVFEESISKADVQQAEVLLATETEVASNSSPSQPEILSSQNEVGVKKTPHTPTTPAISTEPTVADKVLSPEKNPVVAKADDAEPTTADDTETILLVILAILLPPLAVYMKEGVTTRFWIDLICWLLGGGLIFTPFFYGGGLWLFAVVFALLIVLDII